MRDWGETAQVAAECLTAQARMPKVTAEYVEPILVEMALLQRKLLLSEESIERAARGCFDIRDDAYDDREWGELDSQERELYLCQARAALAAALGEDESNE